MDEQAQLEHLIAEGYSRLVELRRRLLLESDPIERRHLQDDVEELQRALFEYRKRLDILSAGAEIERPPTPPAKGAKVFISYSRADQEWLERLRTHLSPLVHEGLIDVWDDTRIVAGTRWREQLEQALAAAQSHLAGQCRLPGLELRPR